MRDQSIQQKVGGTRRMRRRGCRCRGARHFQDTPTRREAASEVPRREGLEVGRPGQVCVDRLEPSCGFQQQRRRITAPAREECEFRLYQVDPGLLKVVRRPRLRDGQQVAPSAERTGLDLRRRCRERALGASRGIEGQHCRALEECGCGGQAASGARTPCRLL